MKKASGRVIGSGKVGSGSQESRNVGSGDQPYSRGRLALSKIYKLTSTNLLTCRNEF